MPELPDLLQDRVIAAIGDRYDVEGELGRGGMAVVYRARDVRLRRPVALKVLPPDLAFREGVRARFLREAETAAQLTHPNIVPIYAADETTGVAWLAMALVEGETLGARMARETRMAPDDVRRILAEVADALAYAHSRGVVHRDIKPDNILLDRESGRPLVTDFGIARAAEADARLTVTGVAVGTPTYMSPEQALGEREVDGRSDMYSLAVVGFQMLVGAPPFQASSAATLLMKHVGEPPTPIAERRADVPPALARAIDRALAKKPDDRWADAAAFKRALLETSVPNAPNERHPPAPDVPVSVAPPAPAPAVPTMPIDAREQRDVWREQLREQRRLWREQRREQRDMMRDAVKDYARGAWNGGGLPAPLPAIPPLSVPNASSAAPNGLRMPFMYTERPLEDRAAAFRSRAVGTFAILLFLAFVNFGTAVAARAPFPWVIFPAIGMLGGLRRRWRPLAREGLSFADVVFAGVPRAAELARQRGAPAMLAQRVRRLQRRITFAAVGAVGAFISFVLGASFHADVMIAPFVAFLALLGYAIVSFGVLSLQLMRAGVPLGDALSTRWESAIMAADRRPRDQVVADDAARLVAADVMAGRYGAVVRGALDDRIVVRETMAKMSRVDRELIPDVMPTIDGLVARIVELAQSLHRLDGDVSPEQLAQIEARLRAVEAEPAHAPDRERKLGLLRRQHASVTELIEKRGALAAKLESAQLALQNLKLELMVLRQNGVGAASGELSSATQEARAVSRDIARALEAAAEVRRI